MNATEATAAGVDPGVFYQAIEIDSIKPSPTNPRKTFDQAQLEELAASIKEKGLIQPIVVRPAAQKKQADPQWELVAGERRWRASKLAGLTTIAAIARNLDDRATLEIQVIENLQRADVHELDEANGYRQLMKDHEYTAEVLSEKVGKSVAYIYARLKLNDLIPELQARFYKGELTAGHAILLARLPESAQIETAKEALFERVWNRNTGKDDRQLVTVKTLDTWIRDHITLELAKAPFSTKDAELLPKAGACVDCPKRSGASPLLFQDLGKKDVCTDKLCYGKKVDAFIARKIESKEAVGLTTDHSKRGKYAYKYDVKLAGGAGMSQPIITKAARAIIDEMVAAVAKHDRITTRLADELLLPAGAADLGAEREHLKAQMLGMINRLVREVESGRTRKAVQA